jgi:general stress protein 26
MKKIPDEIVRFFQDQSFVVVSTVDKNSCPHNSCKGIVEIKQDGRVYLMDLYHSATYINLKGNPRISITAVDEHKFKGYCLKGIIKIITAKKLDAGLLKAWEDRITSRLTQRVVRNITGQQGHPRHPEVLLPKPKYLIKMHVQEIVDLTPHHIK